MGELIFNRYRTSHLQDEGVLGMGVVMAAQQRECTEYTEPYTEWVRWKVSCYMYVNIILTATYYTFPLI